MGRFVARRVGGMSGTAGFIQQLAAPGPWGVTPYRPGKPIAELERELGISGSVKLASNENPLGPGVKALAVIEQHLAEIERYPDSNGYYLKSRLADTLNISPDQIALGNGSNELLEIIARAFLTAGTSAVFSQYCFTVYPIVTQSSGARAIAVPAIKWGADLDAMAQVVAADTRLIFIANPNNPTGTWVDRTALETFLDSLPEHLLVVLDEAYIDYIDQPDHPDGLQLLERFPRLIVLRTFSKIYGLAGLRVGYAVAAAQIIELLNRVRQPFNVNSLGMVAATAALDDQQHLQQSRQVNRDGLVQLSQGLNELRLATIPSRGNFVTVGLGRPADEIYRLMLEKGVIVRPLANYQMPSHLRISVGLESENRRCLQALAECLADDTVNSSLRSGAAVYGERSD